VATLDRRFIRKCVAPILIFSVPKGCSAVSTLAHRVRVLIEALLYGLQQMLMPVSRSYVCLALKHQAAA
jgi:hypothetical protein